MPLLTLNNITMNYGQRRVLDGVSFRVNKGDRIAFIGDNGAGKSTTIRSMLAVVIFVNPIMTFQMSFSVWLPAMILRPMVSVKIC